MSVTVFDIALARGVTVKDGAVSMGEFDRIGLPMLGGCEICGASVAAYNACPSRSGYLRCKSGCIGDAGFATAAEFESWAGSQDREGDR